MLAGKALLGLAAAGGGLLLLAGKKKPKATKEAKEAKTTAVKDKTAKKSPKPGEPGGAPASSQPGADLKKVPAGIQAQIAAALKSDSAKTMRKVADELEKRGYGAQAADLRARAAQLDAEAEGKTPEVESSGPSEEVVARILKAVESGNVAAMRSYADDLDEMGYDQEAKDLRAAAKTLEDAAMASTPTESATKPAAPKVKIEAASPGIAKAKQTTPLTTEQIEKAVAKAGASAVQAAAKATAKKPRRAAEDEEEEDEEEETPIAAGPTAEQRMLAGLVATKMMNAKKGQEDTGTVRQFQIQENISNAAGEFDGKYGSRTGLVLADKYDIVPPKPLYWGGKTYQSLLDDKAAWKTAMLKRAQSDPQRAQEWARAAAV